MLALFDIDRTGNENHVVDTSALATSTAADIGFISFDLLSWVATNSILVGSHHASPQFVKNLESSFVASQLLRLSLYEEEEDVLSHGHSEGFGERLLVECGMQRV